MKNNCYDTTISGIIPHFMGKEYIAPKKPYVVEVRNKPGCAGLVLKLFMRPEKSIPCASREFAEQYADVQRRLYPMKDVSIRKDVSV